MSQEQAKSLNDTLMEGIFRFLEAMSLRLSKLERQVTQGLTAANAPEFVGGTDPDEYVEWEGQADAYVACLNCDREETKVKYVAYGFTDYALVWWTRRCEEEPAVKTWSEMKAAMRKRFVPNHYYKKQYKKLQFLTQGFNTPEEYYREMEDTMMRARVEENEEAMMARYLWGLNPEIADLVEMCEYDSVFDMVHQATKIYESAKTY